MERSRVLYPFGISSARDYHIEDQWNTKPDYVHMEECNNGWSYNGELMIQW